MMPCDNFVGFITRVGRATVNGLFFTACLFVWECSKSLQLMCYGLRNVYTEIKLLHRVNHLPLHQKRGALNGEDTWKRMLSCNLITRKNKNMMFPCKYSSLMPMTS